MQGFTHLMAEYKFYLGGTLVRRNVRSTRRFQSMTQVNDLALQVGDATLPVVGKVLSSFNASWTWVKVSRACNLTVTVMVDSVPTLMVIPFPATGGENVFSQNILGISIDVLPNAKQCLVDILQVA